MSQHTLPRWNAMRTAETRRVEKLLRSHFSQVDAYRYNSASIRVRIVDPRFEGLTHTRRDDMVEPLLRQLPEDTQADIINLITLSPQEIENPAASNWLLALEFEDPSPSDL